MYTALYRAERPEVFSEILGQEHIVKILRNQIETNTVSHAYLFCGTRGTGKTTTARILAKAVNCLDEENKPCGQCENCLAIKEGRFMDVIEIDAASNNGVDNIRELNESVKYPPAVGKRKVYIIDEVHMLSAGAFNALLKTLEEPPQHVLFILATTEPQKLPATILSRCMRLDFKRVPESILIGGMRRICNERQVEITDGALKLLATNADGSVRDGLSILDQCLSTGEKEINREIILDFLGTVGDEFFIQLTDKVLLNQVSEGLLLLNEAIIQGKDVKQIMRDWNSHYRNLLITKFVKNPEDMLNMSTENIEKLKNQSNQITLAEIDIGIITLSRTINEARYSNQPRILLEMAMVKIATGLTEAPITKSRPKENRELPSPDHPTGSENIKPKETAKKNISEEKKETQTDFDLDALWHEVFEKGENEHASFNMIRTGTRLSQVKSDSFVVAAKSQFVMDYANNNRALLESIMEEKTGAFRRMMCYVKGTENSKRADNDENLRSLVEEKLGISVEIE